MIIIPQKVLIEGFLMMQVILSSFCTDLPNLISNLGKCWM